MNIIQMKARDVEMFFEELVRLKYRSMEYSFPKGTRGLERICRQKILEIPDYITKGKAVVIGTVDEDGILVGFLWAYPREFLDEKRLFINGIAVSEQYEGTGIAKKMLSYLKNIGKATGYSAIDLMVAPFNHHAVDFYRAAGFEDERIQMVLKIE